MKNKTLLESSRILIQSIQVEDEAPTVSIANQAIDTDPVVTVKKQREYTGKIKSFKKFLEEV